MCFRGKVNKRRMKGSLPELHLDFHFESTAKFPFNPRNKMRVCMLVDIENNGMIHAYPVIFECT